MTTVPTVGSNKSAGRAVTYAMLGAALVTFGASVGKGRLPEPYVVMGGAGMFIVLGILADITPDVARALALLVFVSIFLAFADELFKTVGKGLGNAQKTSTSAKGKAKVRRGERTSGFAGGGLPAPGSPDDPRIKKGKK